MDWFEWLDWLERWTGQLAISAYDWLIRTIQFAAHWYDRAWYLYYSWWWTLEFYILTFKELAQRAINWWLEKIYSLFDDLWSKIQTLLVDWWDRVWTILNDWWVRYLKFFGDWWDRVNQVLDDWWLRFLKLFEDWWELATRWFEDWCQFFVNLFEEHREKIIYCLTDGWPRVWWFVYERFELLFEDIENHVEGWTMFIDDPAQALWDWFEPRATELVANFLASVWY